MFFSFIRQSVFLLIGLLLGACQPDKPAEQSVAAASASPATQLILASYQGIRRYTGQVGKYPVVMELIFSDTIPMGTYYYQRHGEALNLRAERSTPGKPLLLREVIGDSLLATWHATQPAGPVLSGTWRSADGKRQLPFTLQEDYRGTVRYELEQFEGRGKQAADSVECGRPGVIATLELEVVHLLGIENDKVLQGIQQKLLPVPYPKLRAYVKGQVSDGIGDCSEVKQSAWVTYNANNLLSVTLFEQTYYFGNAHPTHQSTPLTFDLRTGQQLRLQDFLRPGYEQPLRQLLTKRLLTDLSYGEFYQDEGGEVGQPFERWTDEEGRPQQLVPLPHSGFQLTLAGIEFTWQEYEIGPYVIGPQTVEISYAAMRPLLRPNSPLTDVMARFK